MFNDSTTINCLISYLRLEGLEKILLKDLIDLPYFIDPPYLMDPPYFISRMRFSLLLYFIDYRSISLYVLCLCSNAILSWAAL